MLCLHEKNLQSPAWPNFSRTLEDSFALAHTLSGVTLVLTPVPKAAEVRVPSLLENDERLEDPVEFFVHNLEGSLHLVKGESMGRHERWIHALHLQHAQEAFHAQPATWTQAGRNGLFRHTDSPLDAWNMHKVTVTVIAHIGDGAASFRDFDRILEGNIRPQRLNSCVHPPSISQIEDALDNVLFGEISDDIGAIGARKVLPARYRFDSDDQPGPTQLRSHCCHQSHRTLGEARGIHPLGCSSPTFHLTPGA
jgi:hypothetical protein